MLFVSKYVPPPHIVHLSVSRMCYFIDVLMMDESLIGRQNSNKVSNRVIGIILCSANVSRLLKWNCIALCVSQKRVKQRPQRVQDAVFKSIRPVVTYLFGYTSLKWEGANGHWSLARHQ